jgi:sodium-dependent dicarboxylate transporter 2/3/5
MPGVGWAPWLGFVDDKGRAFVDDTTVAVFMVVLCFLIPSGKPDGGPLLRARAFRQVPWGVLLLFGGGLALGAGMSQTGLDRYLGDRLSGLMAGMPAVILFALVATFVTFLSEVTSNVACLTMVLPILKGTCDALHLDARPLMIVATLAASCGFMLPVATPPNAIVYGTGRIRMPDIVKAGLALDLIGIALLTLFMKLWPR